jgi:hypothetical protein
MEDRQQRLLVVLAALLLGAVLIWFLGGGPEPDPVWDEEATEVLWDLEDPTAIVEIAVEGHVELRRSGSRWHITAPSQHRADDLLIDETLDDLSDVSPAIPLLDVAPAKVGLSPEDRVVVRVRESNGTAHVLYIGEPAAVGWKTYVQRPGGPVAVAPGRLHETVLRPWRDLRSRDLFDFDLASVTTVTVTSTEGVLSARLDDQWWLEGFSRAEPHSVEDLLLDLRKLRIETVMEGIEPIEAPSGTVLVELADGTTQSAAFGDNLPTGLLARSSSGMAGAINFDSTGVLRTGPKAIGDPHAFPIDLDNDTRIAANLGGRTIELDRAGPEWMESGHTTSVAARLAEVPAVYSRVPPPDLTEVWGRVSVERTTTSLRVVELGQLIDGHRVARDVAGGGPYLVPADALDAVR